MKKLFVVLFLVTAALSFAQQKYALVIGNGAYTGLGRLNNPVNDANDMTAALQSLGFSVDKVLDGNLNQMEAAITRLKDRLSVSKNSYGFFFYAGHGVQSDGVNYLIPVGASIPSENYLRERAVSVQTMLGELNDAGNELNVVVLDACRDNPFGWSRSGSRGLTVVSNQPADSIIVYATSAGSTAADGTGRNGLFTEQLLQQLKSPGLDIKEIFDRTGAAVSQASGRKQTPAIYSQYFGKAYFGAQPPAGTAPAPQPVAAQPTPEPVDQWGPIINPKAWSIWSRDGAASKFNVAKEFIEGKERDVLNMEVTFPKANSGNAWANINYGVGSLDLFGSRLLRTGSGLRFKALGDGKTWRLTLTTADPNSGGVETYYIASFATKKNKVVEITLPYKRFTYDSGRRGKFDKTWIKRIEFGRPWEDRTSSTLKVFDFEILP